NMSKQERSGIIKIIAKEKEVTISVRQEGRITNSTQEGRITNSTQGNPSIRPVYKYSQSKSRCFNCPTTKDIWGINAGYITNGVYQMEGIQLGVRLEPLFK